MNIIIKKVRVVAAPEPPFVGTRIIVTPTEDSPVWAIRSGNKSAESEAIALDWGDGTLDVVTDLTGKMHTYQKPGRYTVLISDDAADVGLSLHVGTFPNTYAPLVRSFYTNARKMSALNANTFFGCCNMTEVDFRETSVTAIPSACFNRCSSLPNLDGLPPGIREIGMGAFDGCTSLSTVRFPNVVSVGGKEGYMPFANCGNLREIHFAEANRDALMASPAFLIDPEHLGAENAEVIFDPS